MKNKKNRSASLFLFQKKTHTPIEMHTSKITSKTCSSDKKSINFLKTKSNNNSTYDCWRIAQYKTIPFVPKKKRSFAENVKCSSLFWIFPCFCFFFVPVSRCNKNESVNDGYCLCAYGTWKDSFILFHSFRKQREKGENFL